MPVSGRIVPSSRFILLSVVCLLFLFWTATPTLAEARGSKARAHNKHITKNKTDKKKIAKRAKLAKSTKTAKGIKAAKKKKAKPVSRGVEAKAVYCVDLRSNHL
jgi:hypothetical protein